MGELPQGYAPQQVVGTRLVTNPGQTREFTATQETDARTALTRGLAEYVSQLTFDSAGGRQFAFERTYDTWPDGEAEAVYPSACVHAEAPGIYADSKMTPQVQGGKSIPLPDGRYVVSPCEFNIDLILELRTTDSDARAAFCAMLERELSPHDWRYGILLELPHYFNQRASFEMISMTYKDGADESRQRLRAADFKVRASVPVTRLATMSLARGVSRLDVSPDAGIIKGAAFRLP